MSTTPTLQKTTQQIYADLRERHRIPDATDTFDKDQTVIQRMYVDLGALMQELRARKLDGQGPVLPRKLLVFCDVLYQGRNVDAELNTNLRVFARRVELYGCLKLPSTGSITIYAGESAASFFVERLVGPNGYGGGKTIRDEDINGPNKLGLVVRWGAERLDIRDLLNFGLIRDLPETRQCLERLYLYASLLHEESRAMAVPLLRWIRRATASWAGEMQNLYLQSSALLCSAELSARAGSFVPWLSKEIYTRETEAFLASAKSFEDNYEKFRSTQIGLNERARYARLMLANYDDMKAVSDKLLQQAASNFKEAGDSVEFYTSQLNGQSLVAAKAKIDFEYGIVRYKEEKKLELGLEIAFSVVSLGMAVGAAAMGAPDMAALEAINRAVKAGKSSAEAADALKKLAVMGKKMKSVCEALQKLAAAAAALDKVTGIMPPPIDLADADGAETDDPSWDIFRDQVTEMMAPAIQNDIGGAVAYKLALLALTSYGKGLNQSQARYIAAGQEVARLLLQQAANARQSARMMEYIAEMEKAKEPNEEMMRWLTERYGSVKRWLLIALSNYNDAFRYWALEKPVAIASFSDSVARIQEVLGHVVRAQSGVLQKFQPAPQPFNKYSVHVEDAQSIQAFKANRRLSIGVGLDSKAFVGNDRVRLTEIRVWLEGVESADPIRLFVSSSGAYEDRYKRERFGFVTSWPLEWGFRYLQKKKREVQMNAAFAQQFRAFYFEPTPFTTWTVRTADDALDLSGLKRITLEFDGSAIAA